MSDATSQGPLLAALSTSLLLSTAALALLVLPWPKTLRAPMLRALANSAALELLAKPVLWFFALVAATCAYHTRAVLSLQAAYHAEKKHGDIGQKLLHEAVMFRAERDWLISAGAALSLLVLRQIFYQLKDAGKLEASVAALKKQAEGAAAGFKAQLSEIDDLKQKLKRAEAGPSSGAAESSGAAGATEVADRVEVLEEELLKQKAALREARAEADAAEKSGEAVRRQAEGVTKEYARLLRENETLRNKLDDFELVMGDSVKKSK